MWVEHAKSLICYDDDNDNEDDHIRKCEMSRILLKKLDSLAMS